MFIEPNFRGERRGWIEVELVRCDLHRQALRRLDARQPEVGLTQAGRRLYA